MSSFVNWSDLKVGQTYFVLGYHDFEKRLPKIETVVYVGPERDGGQTFHVFRYPSQDDEIEDLTFLDSDPSCIGDLECLILELQGYRGRYGEK
jgi:hypothetical protein